MRTKLGSRKPWRSPALAVGCGTTSPSPSACPAKLLGSGSVDPNPSRRAIAPRNAGLSVFWT